VEVTRWHAIFTHNQLTITSEIPKECVGKFDKEVIKNNLDEFLAKVKKTTNLQADTLIDPDQSPFWKKRKLVAPFTVPLIRKGFNNPPLS